MKIEITAIVEVYHDDMLEGTPTKRPATKKELNSLKKAIMQASESDRFLDTMQGSLGERELMDYKIKIVEELPFKSNPDPLTDCWWYGK